MVEEYYMVKDVAKILKISRHKAYRLVDQPDFPKIRLGRDIRIPKSKFERFMERNLYTDYNF